MILLYVLGAGIFVETSFLCYRSLKKKKLTSRRRIYVDTSSLMDGRILEVAKTGFMSDNMVIPRSVIREMQLLADGKDAEKRNRARHGMDVANALERIEFFDVEILQDALDHTPVDERLLELAKKDRGSAILTCDYNLGKVAATEHIEVLNINELAMVLRAEYSPGEQVTVKIVSKGLNPGQGVGYLPDNTMVVVNNAAKNLGTEIKIELERYMQTAAGKMMFAHPVRAKANKAKKNTTSSANSNTSSNPSSD